MPGAAETLSCGELQGKSTTTPSRSGISCTASAGATFRSYRALPDDERGSVLAHAVAALTVPHLANDKDASGAHEQAVTDLGIDLPSELAAVGAAPFDADIVWNRMNKGMILDVAAETIGSEWARNRAALKKTELVAATAAAATR